MIKNALNFELIYFYKSGNPTKNTVLISKKNPYLTISNN